MTQLSTHIKTPQNFTAAEILLWEQFRSRNPTLYNPYFKFEYTQLVAQLRNDVHVLLVSDTQNIIAFLPFQAKINNNGKIGFARHIGAPMTDYHGFICAPETQFNALSILKRAGFGAFHFSALVDTQNMLSQYARGHMPCTAMDVSIGAQAWREGRDASYRRHLKSTRRRIRKSENIGERRFEYKSDDQDVFDTLIKWKRKKFSETGKYDVLSADWTLGLIKQLWARGPKADLRADMHALYFGDELAAIDLGLTDGTTFHSWMVAYNDDHYNLAPGIQLLEALIDKAGALGYARIDLGEGLDGYKRHYATMPVSVCSGFIAANGPAAGLSKIYGAAEKFGEKNLGGLGRIPGKARRRFGQIEACESTFSGRAKAILGAVKGNGK